MLLAGSWWVPRCPQRRENSGIVKVIHLRGLVLALLLLPSLTSAELPGIDIGFPSGTGWLAGTLFLPQGEGPFPAVVFLTGSGDESYRVGWEGERRSWFWPELQQWFEARGYAVLVFDKPGVGRSKGDWRQEDFGDRARNAMGAVRTLAARNEIDAGRIGLLGHSQGGWIAVSAAASHPKEVDFVIGLAGPAIGVRQQIIEDTENRWRCDDRRMPGLRRAGLAVGLSLIGAAGRIVPAGYLSRIVRYNPAEDLAQLEQPMLALFAGNDIMVMPETNIPLLQRHFGRISGNDALVIQTIEGLDHFFRYGDFCLDGGRPQGFAPEFWQALASPEFWSRVSPR